MWEQKGLLGQGWVCRLLGQCQGGACELAVLELAYFMPCALTVLELVYFTPFLGFKHTRLLGTVFILGHAKAVVGISLVHNMQG